MPPKSTRQENKEQRQKALIESFERFNLTITSDGHCEVIESIELPKECSLMSIDFFIKKYREDGNVEKLLDLVKQLSNIKDACDEAIRTIFNMD